MKNSVVPGAPKSRFVPMAWGAGALASVVMVLGVNGTLSSWTQAVINNDSNDAQSAVAVALSETKGTSTCDTVADSDNEITCAINKFGTVTLDPDVVANQSNSTTVTMKNTGTQDGDLTAAVGACSSVHAADSSAATPSLCGLLTIKMTCGTTPTTVFDTATLSAFDDSDATAPLTIATLAPGESTPCTFVVTLPTPVAAQYSDQIASQTITWTLTA